MHFQSFPIIASSIRGDIAGTIEVGVSPVNQKGAWSKWRHEGELSCIVLDVELSCMLARCWVVGCWWFRYQRALRRTNFYSVGNGFQRTIRDGFVLNGWLVERRISLEAMATVVSFDFGLVKFFEIFLSASFVVGNVMLNLISHINEVLINHLNLNGSLIKVLICIQNSIIFVQVQITWKPFTMAAILASWRHSFLSCLESDNNRQWLRIDYSYNKTTCWFSMAAAILLGHSFMFCLGNW